jgi:GT2 family glycosyltransferase
VTGEGIGVVVVHWRGMGDTRACLESLAASRAGAESAPFDAVVVVNGPGDFDEAAARAALPNVEVVYAPSNEGYAAGCNRGLAALPDAKTVVFLNNDVVLDPDAIGRLDATLRERPDAGIAGPVVTYFDSPAVVWSAGGSVHPWLGYTRHIAFNAAVSTIPKNVRIVEFVSGCAIAVRRDVLDRAGTFDATYFHYFEDTDLCARARAAGYACLVAPDARVLHKVSASAGERGSNRMNAVQAYYFSRNRALFVRHTFRGARRVTAMLSQPLLLLPYEAAKDARDDNGSDAPARLHGVIDGLLGRSGPRR